MTALKTMVLSAGAAALGGATWMACTFDHDHLSPGATHGHFAKKRRVEPDSNSADIRPVMTGKTGEGAKASSVHEKDFAAAAEEARAISSPGLREEMIRSAMQAWALKDPAAALAWAAELPGEGEAARAMSQVCSQVAENDPASAIRLAMDHHLDEIPGDLIGNFTSSWAARDLSAAREWVSAQPSGELRDPLMERIVFEYAKTDPPAAARLVVDQMSGGESQVEAAISVIHQWALNDPQATAAWVGAFPAGELRDRASLELAGVRSRRPE